MLLEQSKSLESGELPVIKSLQNFVAMDEPEDEEMDLLAIQHDFRVDAKSSFGSDNDDDFTADDGPEQTDKEEFMLNFYEKIHQTFHKIHMQDLKLHFP